MSQSAEVCCRHCLTDGFNIKVGDGEESLGVNL